MSNLDSIKKTITLTRWLYLVLTICGLISLMYVPTRFLVVGDATATVNNIRNSEGLFRLGIVSDFMVFLIEIIVPVIFYLLFKPVNKTISLVAAFFRLAMAILQGINVLNYLAVLLILSGADYLAVFEGAQLNALVMLFISLHDYGMFIWQAFFGLHCFFLGYLIYKSGYLPRILGVLLIVSAFGYLSDSFGNLLFSNYKVTMGWLVMLTACSGELPFTVWFLVKGVNFSRVKTATPSYNRLAGQQN